MSGPKISVYSLTGRAKTIVFGQIRCEQQSLACAARIQAILKSMSSFPENFDQYLRNIQLLIKRTGSGKEQIENINRLQNIFERDLEDIKRELNANMPMLSPKYQITEEAYTEKQAELKKLQALQKRAEKLKKALDEALQNNKSNVIQLQKNIVLELSDLEANNPEESNHSFLGRNNEHNIKQIQRSIADDLSEVYSFDLIEEPEVSDTSFSDKKAAVNKELSGLLKDNTLSKELSAEIKQAIIKLQMITEMQQLKTYDSITVMGLLKRIDAYKQKIAQEEIEFGELVERYKALCTMAGEDAKDYSFSREDQAALDVEIERLEMILVRQQEQAYISDCVDEVMEEMGYDLIGTRNVKKRSGKRFKNELFTFNEGTAVNITFSPDGQISMELGGLAHEDRIPTSEESEILTRDMESFCGEFAVFEQKLRARGVIVGNRIALSPPSAEYAAIINVNDYNISESTQITEMSVKEKQRKVAEKKTLQRDT